MPTADNSYFTLVKRLNDRTLANGYFPKGIAIDESIQLSRDVGNTTVVLQYASIKKSEPPCSCTTSQQEQASPYKTYDVQCNTTGFPQTLTVDPMGPFLFNPTTTGSGIITFNGRIPPGIRPVYTQVVNIGTDPYLINMPSNVVDVSYSFQC